MSGRDLPALAGLPSAEPMAVALRAFTTPAETSAPPSNRGRSPIGSSGWTLIFDCETSTDAAQRLRFGVYQVRKGGHLHEQGIFYEPSAFFPEEFELLEKWSDAQGLRLRTRAEFIDEVFFPVGYDDQGTIVGFNLPFDLSRIAIAHGSARGKMRGGFSLELSPNSRRPRVQVVIRRGKRTPLEG